MLRTEKELEGAKKQLSKLNELYETQMTELQGKGLSKKQAEESLSSSFTYAKQCQEEIDLYERLKKGELPPEDHFSSLGRYFVAARIARKMTQRQLAERLNVKESAVSRDERNEYHGMSTDKMYKVAAVLGLKVLVQAS